jgi:two-component system, OmpR family, phosphate regulon sensor histidine kinase PhoR
VIDDARALSAGRHTLLIDAEAARVRGNRDELRSAIGNLVSNAIRYTPAGGTIGSRGGWWTTAPKWAYMTPASACRRNTSRA